MNFEGATQISRRAFAELWSRRVRAWRTVHGQEQGVMFRQVYEAGRLELSDFTEMGDLAVTVGGLPLDHWLHHLRLACSGFVQNAARQGGDVLGERALRTFSVHAFEAPHHWLGRLAWLRIACSPHGQSHAKAGTAPDSPPTA